MPVDEEDPLRIFVHPFSSELEVNPMGPIDIDLQTKTTSFIVHTLEVTHSHYGIFYAQFSVLDIPVFFASGFLQNDWLRTAGFIQQHKMKQ